MRLENVGRRSGSTRTPDRAKLSVRGENHVEFGVHSVVLAFWFDRRSHRARRQLLFGC
jgi:hypothetical protein